MKEIHLGTVVEVLQGIRASEISGMLGRIWGSEGGSEVVDCLMKYLCVALSCPPSLVRFYIQCSGWPSTTADVMAESRRKFSLQIYARRFHSVSGST